MVGLFASIFALAIGPLIYQTFGPLKRTDKIVSGFILIVISATLFFEVLPSSVQQIGLVAILLAVIGFAGPTLIEKTFRQSASRTHNLTLFLGISGLVLHAIIDGAALQSAGLAPNGDSLSIAVILHRLPVGLTVWWLLRPLLGEKIALLTLIMMATATALGYFLSMHFIHYSSSNGFAFIQALISGSLLHVVFHKPHEDGCNHASNTHEHEHQHENSGVEDYNLPWTQKLPSQWEIVGMVVGLIVFFFIHELT